MDWLEGKPDYDMSVAENINEFWVTYVRDYDRPFSD